MASSEGFLTDEQRGMLKLASQNVESLSSSPKSPSSLLSDYHIKAPFSAKASIAGTGGRHVRRSHSGKFIRIKKGESLWHFRVNLSYDGSFRSGLSSSAGYCARF